MATDKLTFQDAAFLRLESPQRPFHVAGLMVLREPENMPRGYYRKLVRHCGRLNELWPVFDKKLKDPENMRSPSWVPARDYDPNYHVFHYALPSGGKMEALLKIVSRAHERVLDRNRPLWEVHLVEGLPDGRFALYCKVHHALVDGVGALRIMDSMFSTSPDAVIDFRRAKPRVKAHHQHMSLVKQFGAFGDEIRKHYAALPEMSGLLVGMGIDALMGKQDVPPLPFTAPRTIFNKDIDGRREIIVGELPMGAMHRLAARHNATLNDVLLCVCGGALREYLKSQNALPRRSLEAGVPVSIKADGEDEGNRVGFIISQLFTGVSDPLERLRHIVKVTTKAKFDLKHMSRTAVQDYTNMLMMPTLLLSPTGRASQIPPPINIIISNVPGSREKLYLEGAELESIYPLSIIMDGMGINITVVSYMNRMCVAMTSCPAHQPGIEGMGSLIRQSWRALSQASAAA